MEGAGLCHSTASYGPEASRVAGRKMEVRDGKVEIKHRNFLNDGTQAGGLGQRPTCAGHLVSAGGGFDRQL